MKLLPRIKALKAIASVLFIVIFAATAAAAVGFAFSVSNGYFEYAQCADYTVSGQVNNDITGALMRAAVALEGGEAPERVFAPSNLSYKIYGADGTEIFSSPDTDAVFESTHTEFLSASGMKFTAVLHNPPVKKDIFCYSYYLYNFIYSMRYGFCIITVSGFAVCLFLAYFIMCGAGRRRKSDEVYLNMADKLPLDLYAVMLLAGCFVSGMLSYRFVLDFAFWTLFLICPCLLINGALTAELISTVAKHVKCGTWWSGTLLRRLCISIRGIVAHIAEVLEKVFLNLTLVWKSIVISVVYLILTVIAINSRNGAVTVIWLVISVAAVVLICLGVLSADKLRKGAEKIADGDLDYKIDTEGMILDFRYHAESLNKINDVLSKTVDERTRSEKFKAELITNVSHDIKTPITSIINYVDLLSKEGITDAEREEYLGVLHRQSERLRKLTVDLIEASKASTGCISAELAPADICELLRQSTGEYSERIPQQGLTLILDVPDDPLNVLADGRMMWRVFDNLLSNICKYSQPGTRVYVTARREDGNIVTDFKNISREKLTVSSEDLTERFVRGDSSRTTEGSGLGLSIARSFVELQNGKFTITIDGDLFKAEIVLKERKDNHAGDQEPLQDLQV